MGSQTRCSSRQRPPHSSSGTSALELHPMPRLSENSDETRRLHLLVRAERQTMLDVAHAAEQLGHDGRGQLAPDYVEGQVEQPVVDPLDVGRERRAARQVDGPLVHDGVGHARALEQVQHPSHVPAAQVQDAPYPVLGVLDLLGVGHLHQPAADLTLTERREPESRAPALQRGDDLADVVAYQAEPCVLRVLLDDPAQGELGVARHGVGLVEYYKLDPLVEELAGAGELLDLVADGVDPAGVRGVELERHGGVGGGGAVHALRGRDDCGCLTLFWRIGTVQCQDEEVRFRAQVGCRTVNQVANDKAGRRKRTGEYQISSGLVLMPGTQASDHELTFPVPGGP
ncbi:hypothetical protein THAOC_03657 [Thalassiosira oceanica]|uniref:Uncharacterized protein n=1 Tax=Thalassiosira oceanica TaxID=159749 RepID=K0TPP5_THAOC|nr:hypothetical protein THAOC_03657 [Thalassiosira oceanica]|eukprot:EJK74657.1 hypothetical protein THAOC_03657 [Thalassiosira oceanica]